MTRLFERNDIIKEIENNSDGIFDLSEMNIFEATKAIIMISTYSYKKPNKRFKYKVSTPNIENLLKEMPINQKIEFV